MTREANQPLGPLTLRLERYPEPEVNLRAWNAADEYLLDWIAEHRTVERRPCCVVNDSFGALALGLVRMGERAVVSWSDSWVAHQGAQANALANDIAVDAVDWLPSTRQPRPTPPSNIFGLVVVRVPKALDQLQCQLRDLAPFVDTDTLFVGGGMTKQIHTSTIERFEEVIGPATTTLARKKARLIVSRPRETNDSTTAHPSSLPAHHVGSGGLTLVSDPALFSPNRIDPASALLLEAVRSQHVLQGVTDVVDLGCGSGVIGLSMLQDHGNLALTFTDESYRAVEASRVAWAENVAAGRLGDAGREPPFVVDDCGSRIAEASVDLVCINPPFHSATARTGSIAKRMFANSARILRPGGSVVVVGNRHLKYHQTLRQWFTKPRVIASDRRFVVLQAETHD